MMRFALGYYLGCALSVIVGCTDQSHGWCKSILYVILSPITIPVLLVYVMVDSVARRRV
jgi:hypothetical protein